MQSGNFGKRQAAFVGTVTTFAAVLAFSVGQRSGAPVQAGESNTAAAQMARMWPMFGGTNFRNMVNLIDKNLPDDFDVKKGTNIKWKADLGSRSYGGPVIYGGRVFVGTNNENPRDPTDKGDRGIVMAFDEATGRFLWQASHKKLPSGQVNDWPKEGICSTPVVEGDKLWYVSNRCTVVCATTAGENGKAKFLWEYDMMKELDVFPHNLAACSPLIVGELIFVVTANGVDEGHINIPSPAAPSFIALNKNTGKLVWKDNSPGKNIMHGQWSNPTYAEIKGQPQIIFPGGDGWLRAFEPATGKLLWKFDCNPKDAKYELGGKGTRNDFIATPVVYDNKVYIGVGQDPEHFTGVAYLWCIDPSKPKVIPEDKDISPVLRVDGKFELNPKMPPAVKDNPASGLVWVFGGPDKSKDAQRDFVFGRTMSTCAIHDGLCYAAELDGYLHCLDAATGKLYWTHDLKGSIWGSPYWVDGKIYLGTEDGDLFIFKHGKEKQEPTVIEIGQPIRSTPASANGVLYVMTESTLYAIAHK
jgi:outer membrane protein assembly factor BamB